MDFGSRLRQAREQRGVSLRQIATTTKISIGALEALERNAISRLPGGIFTRAFVRAYAIEVGLDPEQTVREFIAQFPHESVTAGTPHASDTEDHQAIESERLTAQTLLKLIVVSAPVAIAIIYFTLSGRRAVPERPVRAAAAPVQKAAAVAPPPAAIVEPPVAAAPAVDPAAAAALRVTMTARAPCWVEVRVDGARALARLMQPGDTSAFDVRDELEISAGNAGALAVMINDQPARSLGASGEVLTVRITSENYRTYLAER